MGDDPIWFNLLFALFFLINGLLGIELSRRGYPGRWRSLIGFISFSFSLIIVSLIIVDDSESYDLLPALFLIAPASVIGVYLVYSGFRIYSRNKKVEEIGRN